MEKKVGIIGFKGFVGSAFYEIFCKEDRFFVVGIDRENYAKHVGEEFDILINANGNSSKRLAETDPKKDWEMNVKATEKFLEDFSSKHFIHLSTVEVYNDKTRKKTTIESAAIEPSTLSNYGKSKYFGEKTVQKHPSHLIIRLAGMVGKNMKKGPVYDILYLNKLFISEKSRLHFMNTLDVARITKKLIEKDRWNEIYNLVGKGTMRLADIAKMAKVKLLETGKEEIVLNISTKKIEKEVDIKTTKQTITEFLSASNLCVNVDKHK